MNIFRTMKTLTHMLLTIVIILFIFTGFGISNYQIIEYLTSGTVSKLTSFQIHSNLIIPFMVLLIAHIGFTIRKKFQKEKHL
ncbi:MAG: hypothetical protein NTY91_06510 [Euryarchaeota archaeon]|nr:hypothetical protein [Euryarchaeota archaeon]